MKPLPITLVEPTLEQVIAGACTAVRRPAKGLLGNVAPGQLLWVREPFHLHERYNGLKPTAAAGFGALPYFAADFGHAPGERFHLGPRRYGRNLLKIWHRQHLRVTATHREPLQAITDAQIRAEGFRFRNGYAYAWNLNLGLSGWAAEWERNPEVLVIEFERVGAAIEGLCERHVPQPKPRRLLRSARPAPAPDLDAARRRLVADDEQARWREERQWCAQCEKLVDRATAAACGSPFCSLRADAAQAAAGGSAKRIAA